MLKRSLPYGLALIFILSLYCGAHPGRGDSYRVYAPVPQRLRPRLGARLKLYVALRRAQQFEKLYGLFSESHMGYLKAEGIGGKSEYVTFQNVDIKHMLKVTDFKPASTVMSSDGAYIISGLTTSPCDAGLCLIEGSIKARWEHGDWYFSELGVEIGGLHRAPNKSLNRTRNQLTFHLLQSQRAGYLRRWAALQKGLSWQVVCDGWNTRVTLDAARRSFRRRSDLRLRSDVIE